MTSPTVAEAATAWRAAGVSVIQARADGTKAPAGTWKVWTERLPTQAHVDGWFADGYPGLGLVCGAVSGGLEMLELEGRAVEGGALERLTEAARAAELAELWTRVCAGYLESTPSGGLHWLYRVDGAPVPGNTKLAKNAAGEVLAETRGEGGFVVVAPSHGPVHPTGQPWTLLAGQPGQVPTITAAERTELHRLVRLLDEMPTMGPDAGARARSGLSGEAADHRQDDSASALAGLPSVRIGPAPASFAAPARPSAPAGYVSPGDDFESREDWSSAYLLAGAGWTLVRSVGGYREWRRPGKDIGISATTGRDPARDRLYVMSTSTVFPAEQSITKFSAYAWLQHNGDHEAAAAELSMMGYGVRPVLTAPAVLAQPGQVLTAGTRGLRLTSAASVRPARVRWLWDGRVPLGEITLVAGREGAGKSTLLARLARDITLGLMPGEFIDQPRAVLYAAAEDSLAYTVVPRLMAAGAALDRVHFVEVTSSDTDTTRMVLPLDTDAVMAAGREVGASVLMLDPGLSFLDDKIDTFRTPEVRPALESLRRSAERFDMSVIMLCHFNKSNGTDVLTKIAGARAFAEIARAALAVAVDEPDDNDEESAPTEPVVILSQAKNNLGRMNLDHLTYVIRDHELATDDGMAHVGKLEWTGTSQRTAEQALNGRRQGRAKGENRIKVIEWVRSQPGAVHASAIRDHFSDLAMGTLKSILYRCREDGDLYQPIPEHYACPIGSATRATSRNPPAHTHTTDDEVSATEVAGLHLVAPVAVGHEQLQLTAPYRTGAPA